MGRMMKLAERMREAMERECAEKLASLNRRLNREFEERYIKQWERNQEALSGWDRDYSELKDRYKLIIANLREAHRKEVKEAAEAGQIDGHADGYAAGLAEGEKRAMEKKKTATEAMLEEAAKRLAKMQVEDLGEFYLQRLSSGRIRFNKVEDQAPYYDRDGDDKVRLFALPIGADVPTKEEEKP